MAPSLIPYHFQTPPFDYAQADGVYVPETVAFDPNDANRGVLADQHGIGVKIIGVYIDAEPDVTISLLGTKSTTAKFTM